MAVHLLAVGPGDVRSRLRNAFIELSAVKETDFPEELRADYALIVSSLTKHEPVAKEGKLVATLERMQNRTGAKIAERILGLQSDLEAYVADNE